MSYSQFSSMSPLQIAMVILTSLFTTLFMYATFPIAFSAIRSKPISTKKYRGICIAVIVGIALIYSIISSFSGGSVSKGAPAIIWGTIGYQIGKDMLKKKGLFDNYPSLNVKASPDIDKSAAETDEKPINLLSQDETSTEASATEERSVEGTSPVLEAKQAKIRFCRKCGKELRAGSVFCSYCGTKILEELQ